ncbi:MAG: tetratricopeptide repeat protein, partial [Gemmatimonadales bacterium]
LLLGLQVSVPATAEQAPLAAAKAAIPAAPDPCREALDEALAAITRGEGAEAARIFSQGLEVCPEHPGLLREFSALRFRQNRHPEARELAHRLLEVEPGDEWALDLVASTHYMEGAALEALDAWNRIDRPVVTEVRSGVLHPELVLRISGIRKGRVLRPGDLAGADARLRDLPAARRGRADLRPLPGGEAAVALEVEPRARHPFHLLDIPGHLVRGVRGEVNLQTADLAGHLEWSRLRLRRDGSLRSARGTLVHPVPGVLPVPGTGLLAWEGGVERARRARGPGAPSVLERHRSVGLLLVRRAPDRLLLSAGGGLEDRRTFEAGGGRRGGWYLLGSGRFTPRQPASEGGLPWRLELEVEGGSAGGAEWARTRALASIRVEPRSGWELGLLGRMDAVSTDIPLDREPRFGADRSANRLMRARNTTGSGGVLRPAFPGRAWASGTLEVTRWGTGTARSFVGLAAVADGAHVLRSRPEVEGPRRGVDAGIGLRLREPGGEGRARIDWAMDLSGGGSRLSAAWERRIGLPGLR